MKKIGSGCVFVLFFLTLLSATWAADVEVTATVDRNEMNVGDSFTYTISITSKTSQSVDEPRLPNIDGLELLNTWRGSESRSTFVGGSFKVERSQKFNYMFVAKKQGSIPIGASEVNVNGTVFRTKPIQVKVLAGGATPPPSRQRERQDPFQDMDDMFSQLLNRRQLPGYKTQPTNNNEAFFIQLDVDKTKAYEGEQILVNWYIYTRGQILEIDTLKYPSLNGFWKEDIEIATRLNFTSEIVNGIAYKKALLASYALFPIKAGNITIDTYKAKCRVVTPSNFGFGRSQYYTKSSKPVKVEILQIPKEGRPADFSGAVGQFKMSVQLDSQKAKANQPITLKVRFDGKGNAKLIDLPAIEWPSFVELYDTKKESKFFKNGKSFKEFEILLIPRQEGELEIPAFTVSLFDPVKSQFYTESSQPIKIHVQAGDGSGEIESSPLTANQEKETNQKPQLPSLNLGWDDAFHVSTSSKALMWSGGYFLIFIILLWRAYVEFGWGQKRKDLIQLIKNRFKDIHVKANNGEWRGVGVDVTNAVYFVLGEVSGLGGANLEIEKILLKSPPSVRREIEVPLQKLMRVFEKLSFAPEEVVGDLKENKNLKKNVTQMENLLIKAIRLGLGMEEHVEKG